MNSLSDEQLIDAYKKALESNLEPNFIELLRKELNKRQITVKCLPSHKNKR